MTEYQLNTIETRLIEKVRSYGPISPVDLVDIDRKTYQEIVKRPKLHRHALRMGIIRRGFVKPETEFLAMTKNQLRIYARKHYLGLTVTEIATYCGHPNFIQVIRRKGLMENLVEKEIITREETRADPRIVSERRRRYVGIRGTKYNRYFSGGETNVDGRGTLEIFRTGRR